MLGPLCTPCLVVPGPPRRGVSSHAYEVLESGACGDWNGLCGRGQGPDSGVPLWYLEVREATVMGRRCSVLKSGRWGSGAGAVSPVSWWWGGVCSWTCVRHLVLSPSLGSSLFRGRPLLPPGFPPTVPLPKAITLQNVCCTAQVLVFLRASPTRLGKARPSWCGDPLDPRLRL